MSTLPNQLFRLIHFYEGTLEDRATLSQLLCNDPRMTELIINQSEPRISMRGQRMYHLARAIENNLNLTKVDLSRTFIGDAGVKELAQALRFHSTVRTLVLSFVGMTNTGAKELALALETNSTLKVLDLTINSIQSAGAKRLASALTINSTLQYLDLSQNEITITGARELARALEYNAAVTHLNLSRNNFLNYSRNNFLNYSRTDSFGDAASKELAETLIRFNSVMTHVELSDGSNDLAFMLELADGLASSNDRSCLQAARRLIVSMPTNNPATIRAQWLLPFIDNRLESIDSPSGVKLCSDFIASGSLKVVALIGKGHFANVYLATLGIGRLVVVKYLDIGLIRTNTDAVASTLMERYTCRIISSKQIPNVVKYLGMVDDYAFKKRGLVFELCADISAVEPLVEQSLNQERNAFFSLPVIPPIPRITLQPRPRFDYSFHPRTGYIDPPSRPTFLPHSLPAIPIPIPDWSDQVITSLRSAIVFRGNPRIHFSAAEILIMLQKVAAALHKVHKLGFIHRDIADRNVLFDGEGNVQLADFGLTKFVGAGTSEEGGHDFINLYRTYLTPGHQYAIAWWAPECIGDNKLEALFSTSSDVYSFGVLMWQCFAHRDPFEEIKPKSMNTRDIKAAASEIIEKILNDERPDCRFLDPDTPTGLVQLIEMCWESDPEERPALPHVIDKLGSLITQSQQDAPFASGTYVLKSFRSCKRRWFDVQRMYLELPILDLERRSRLSGTAPTFTFRLLLKRLARVSHSKAPSHTIPQSLLGDFPSGRRPVDVFVIHTGAQKREQITPLCEAYEFCGLECFLDMNMTPSDGSNTEAMSFALETCRYAIVVISKEFLEREDPAEELAYAVERRDWLRRSKQYDWESVRVVLFNLSISEYKKARNRHKRLPNITSNTVLYEWSQDTFCGYQSWSHVFHTMKAEMIKDDKENGAVKKWKRFLRDWNSLDNTFPHANKVYTHPPSAGGSEGQFSLYSLHAGEASRQLPSTVHHIFLGEEIERIEVATEHVKVPRGVSIKVKRARTCNHTIDIASDAWGAIKNIETGFKQAVSDSVRAKIVRQKGNSYEQSETREYEVELKGETSPEYRLVWVDVWRNGHAELRQMDSTIVLPFRFREQTELQVISVDETVD